MPLYFPKGIFIRTRVMSIWPSGTGSGVCMGGVSRGAICSLKRGSKNGCNRVVIKIVSLFIKERTFIYICAVMRTRDDSKRQAIYEKALKMIVEKGFDGMSMQKLARAAGVSPATIYIHFRDRDDMIWQLWNEEMKKMVTVTLEGFSPEMSFE